MMLIFLTFGMLVFLHELILVSINLEDNLTWFLKGGITPGFKQLHLGESEG